RESLDGPCPGPKARRKGGPALSEHRSGPLLRRPRSASPPTSAAGRLPSCTPTRSGPSRSATPASGNTGNPCDAPGWDPYPNPRFLVDPGTPAPQDVAGAGDGRDPLAAAVRRGSRSLHTLPRGRCSWCPAPGPAAVSEATEVPPPRAPAPGSVNAPGRSLEVGRRLRLL